MYNSIYPVNINYRKGGSYRVNNGNNMPEDEKVLSNGEKKQDTFPNGTKVSIDYTKGQINISQVITDFRNTIVAINAPDDVKDEVNLYLSLVEKESLKEVPSKDIILSNLRNASKVSDNYIAKSLNKPSNVVEGWIDALFLQKINLKSNPDEINPDFLLEFPQKAQEKINASNELNSNETIEQNALKTPDNEQSPVRFLSVASKEKPEEINVEEAQYTIKNQTSDDIVEQESEIELSQIEADKTPVHTLYSPKTDTDKLAKELLVQAKNEPDTSKGDTNRLNILNEALGIMSKGENNPNIKAAIHFERGKVFDEYDYVDYALRDYWEASKTDDLNLKAQAFYKTARIYDEFREFYPALDNYLSCVAYTAEAGNFSGQTYALNDIASLYAGKYDYDNTTEYSSLALEVAKDTKDNNLIAKTYSNIAQNYQYLGDNEKALNEYKNALEVFVRGDESFEQTAYNYEQASIVMRNLGNNAKADKLLAKANLYYQKARQNQSQQELAS